MKIQYLVFWLWVVHRQTPMPPKLVTKTLSFSSQRIEFSGSRGGVSSIVVSGLPTTVSQLLIQRARMADSGTYSCHLHYSHRPDLNTNLRSHINVHVLQGELRL